MLNNKNVNIAGAVCVFALIVIHATYGLSWYWYLVVIGLLLATKVYGSMVVSSQFFTPALCHGTQGIALTFDDGPIPERTARILDILEAHQIKAAFFCIGNRVAKQPELVQRMHQQQHIIGNHSFFHGKFFDLQSEKAMAAELAKTDEEIYKAISVQPRFFRPPYGVTNPNLAQAIKKGKYITAGWSIRSLDTVIKDEERLFQSVIKKIKQGDIILFHDFGEATISVLPRLVHYIKDKGWQIVRLDELLQEQPYV